MKKIITLLTVGVVGIMGWQAYTAVQQLTEPTRYYGNEVISIESPFQKDPVIDQFVRESENLDEANYSKIYADRVSGSRMVLISINGSEIPEYQAYIKNMEQVLGIEGMSNFINDEAAYEKEKAIIQTLEPWGEMQRSKVFGDVIVSTGRQNHEADSTPYTQLMIMKDKLKDERQQALVDQFTTPHYFLKEWITGGQEDMMVLANEAELARLNNIECVLDATGNVLAHRPSQIRYEIFTNQGGVQGVRLIAQSRGELWLSEEDFVMLQQVTTQLGIDPVEVETLLRDLIKKPQHKQKDQIGSWHYEATMRQENYGSNNIRNILTLTLQ